MHTHKKDEAGRSMIEVLGYMAVAMVIMAGMGRMVTNAYNDYKTSKASLQVGELALNITKAAAIDTTYQDVINSINEDNRCDENHIIPHSFNVKRSCSGGKGPTIFHAFGGKAEVALSGDKFLIIFHNLTKQQCIELALKDWINNKNIDLDQIIINGNYWYWPIYSQGGTSSYVLPVTRAKVAGTQTSEGQCKEKANIITWVFN